MTNLQKNLNILQPPPIFPYPTPFLVKMFWPPLYFQFFINSGKVWPPSFVEGAGVGAWGEVRTMQQFSRVSVQVMWQYKPWTPFLLKKTFTYLILIQGHFSTDSFFLTLYATNAFNGVFIQPTLISFTHSVYKMLFYQSIRLHEKSMASCIYVGNTGLKWVKAFIFLLINASRS